MQVVTETRTVTEFVEVTKPLPETLPAPLNYPDSVVFGVDGDITVDDVLDMVFDLMDVVDRANADREDAAELTQPLPSEPVPQ